MSENLKKWNTNTVENSVEKYKKSATEEVQKSDLKNAACIPKNSLCWNCKRACTDRLHQCSWSSEFKPVKGWVAEAFTIKEGSKKPIPSYIVKECPKYRQRDRFEGEFTKAIAFFGEYFHKSNVTIYSHLEQYIERYETETGEKIPVWVLWAKKDREWEQRGVLEE